VQVQREQRDELRLEPLVIARAAARRGSAQQREDMYSVDEHGVLALLGGGRLSTVGLGLARRRRHGIATVLLVRARLLRGCTQINLKPACQV
jgi:hypothetical protein